MKMIQTNLKNMKFNPLTMNIQKRLRNSLKNHRNLWI